MPTAINVPRDTFKKILEKLLFPLFPKTTFLSDERAAIPPRGRHQLVTQIGAATDLRLMPHRDATVSCAIRRPQAFTRQERNIVETFLARMERYYRDWDEPYADDTGSSVMTEVISCSALPGAADFMNRAVTAMLLWAEQTYEGRRIALNWGIEVGAEGSAVSLQDIVGQDFLKVLGNGQDSILVFNETGSLLRHETLNESNDAFSLNCPLGFRRIAEWTQNHDTRVAIVLSRNGEMLIFREGALVFAKRRGAWRYFAHDATISQFAMNAMARRSDTALRRGLYLTALDVAFTRTGACFGVFNAADATNGLAALVEDGDRLDLPAEQQGTKTLAVARIIHKNKFHELDRDLRSELAAMDGAIVLDHTGAFIAAGAILKNPGGRTGGGREQASMGLAQYGLGIKVSSDGYIRIRGRDGNVIAEVG